MAFLTIAGVDYPVQTQNAQQNEHEYSGEKVRAFNNALRSTRGQRKRSWSFVIGPIYEIVYEVLDAATVNDTVVNCTGDFCAGATIACIVTLTSGPFVRDGLTFQRVAGVTIEEV